MKKEYVVELSEEEADELMEEHWVGELVRCKDCRYHDAGENEVDAWNRCMFHHIDTDDNKFCSDGEREP